ncbi:hypothetical protein ACW9IO_17935 [Pseudomonas azotoformans]
MSAYTDLQKAAEYAAQDTIKFADENEEMRALQQFHEEVEPGVVLALIADCDQLKSENEALRKDAARYRWLNTKSTSGPNICVSEWVGPHEYPLIGDELDAAVDAAMGTGEQP